jgi:hypothetical protein
MDDGPWKNAVVAGTVALTAALLPAEDVQRLSLLMSSFGLSAVCRYQDHRGSAFWRWITYSLLPMSAAALVGCHCVTPNCVSGIIGPAVDNLRLAGASFSEQQQTMRPAADTDEGDSGFRNIEKAAAAFINTARTLPAACGIGLRTTWLVIRFDAVTSIALLLWRRLRSATSTHINTANVITELISTSIGAVYTGMLCSVAVLVYGLARRAVQLAWPLLHTDAPSSNAIATAVAALPLLLDLKSRREAVTCFLVPRAADALLELATNDSQTARPPPTDHGGRSDHQPVPKHYTDALTRGLRSTAIFAASFAILQNQ